MTEALNERVSKLKAALETIEREVVVGAATRDTLEDFKLAIDHIRVSVWAILTEQHSGGQQAIVARYRVKRVTEICRHLLFDIDAGLIPASDPELVEFRTVLEDTASRVTSLLQSGD
jgi:hypothetical protein